MAAKVRQTNDKRKVLFAFFASLQRRPHFRSFSHAVFCSGVGQSAATSPPIETPTPATAFPKPPTGFPVAGSVAQGARAPIYYTYFIPSKKVSTFQLSYFLRSVSRKKWLKGLKIKPFNYALSTALALNAWYWAKYIRIIRRIRNLKRVRIFIDYGFI